VKLLILRNKKHQLLFFWGGGWKGWINIYKVYHASSWQWCNMHITDMFNSYRKSNKMQQCIKIFIIQYLCEAQHVSGDTPPIIRTLKLHWHPLVFHTWKVVCTCRWWTLLGTLCLTTSTIYTYKQPSMYEKPEAASAVLGSWWWAVCRPKHVELHINIE
jgi:hypothetical protein